MGESFFSLAAVLGVAIPFECLLPLRYAAGEGEPANSGLLAGSSPVETDDHGRSATSPSEIPRRGWKDILLRVYANISKHRVLALAAGMTYYSILANFPAIAALVALYGLSADPSTIAEHLHQAADFLPVGRPGHCEGSDRASGLKGRRSSDSSRRFGALMRR